MTQHIDLFDGNVDDTNVHEMRVGQIGTVKGMLENVRYGGAMLGARGEKQNLSWGADPSLCIAFSDWGMLFIALRDYATARSISIPLGAYVCVKVQCINEDAELMALAIWEPGKGNILPLGEPWKRNELVR